MEPEVRNKLDLAIEIRDVYAREILDFAGNPAIEVEVLAGGEIIGKASMAGKNYSKKEQTEKQQVHIEEKIELLNSQIAPEIIGENVFEQRKIDTILKENGNEQTSFAISLAVARAAAAAEKIPLYRYLGGVRAVHPSMPQLIRKEEIEIEKIKEEKCMLKKRYILAAAICLAIAGCGKDKAPEEPAVAVVEMENTVEEPEVKEENEKISRIRVKAVGYAIYLLGIYYIVMLVRGVYDGNLEEADNSVAIVYMAFNVICLEFGVQKSRVDRLFKK